MSKHRLLTEAARPDRAARLTRIASIPGPAPALRSGAAARAAGLLALFLGLGVPAGPGQADTAEHGFRLIGRAPPAGDDVRIYTAIWSGERHAYVASRSGAVAGCTDARIDLVDMAATLRQGPLAAAAAPVVSTIRPGGDRHVAAVRTHLVGARDILIAATLPCDRAVPGSDTGETAERPGPGLTLWDVSVPQAPRLLAEALNGLGGARGIGTFDWRGRSYLLASSDGAGLRDLSVIDISAPHAPRIVANTGPADWLHAGGLDAAQLERGTSGGHFATDIDVRVTGGGPTALVAYWDAGIVMLDLSDPAAPRFLGDSAYAARDPLHGAASEGNAGTVAFVGTEGREILSGDIDGHAMTLHVEVAGTRHRAAGAAFGPDAAGLSGILSVTGGDACSAASMPAAGGANRIALIEAGGCAFQRKAANAAARGYAGYIVANGIAQGDALAVMAPAGGAAAAAIPGVRVEFSAGEHLKAAGAVPLAVRAAFDGWGYLRRLGGDGAAALQETGHYAPAAALDAGAALADLSIADIAVAPGGGPAFAAWGPLGVRALDIRAGHAARAGDGAGYISRNIVELARFSGGADADFRRVRVATLADGRQVVLALDARRGLFLLALRCDGAGCAAAGGLPRAAALQPPPEATAAKTDDGAAAGMAATESARTAPQAAPALSTHAPTRGYIFTTTEAEAVTGYFVASSGDHDGDGVSDVVIGSRFADGTGFNNGEVYLVAAADMAAADAADGTVDGQILFDNIAGLPGSYRLQGGADEDAAGRCVAPIGDFDGDGLDDFLIGAPGVDGKGPVFGNVTGAAYLVSAADLPAADAADGAADGIIDLTLLSAQPGSYEFIGSEEKSALGRSVAAAGDTDADGLTDLIMSSTYADESRGLVHLISHAAIPAADAADGAADGTIYLQNVPGLPGSYVFRGEQIGDLAGRSVASAGDISGDGVDDLIMGAVLADAGAVDGGAIYVVASSDFAAADAADGAVDGTIELANIAAQPASFRLLSTGAGENAGRSVASLGDLDADGLDELIMGARYGNAGGSQSGETYLVPGAVMAAADAADGSADGTIDLDNVAAQPGAYQFVGRESGDYAGRAVATAGDFDDDGIGDLMIGARAADGSGIDSGEVYLISGAELDAADLADGLADGVVDLDSVAGLPGSYRILGGEEGDRAGRSVASAGDVDGDGLGDLIIGAYYADTGARNSGETILLFAAGLAETDAADGAADGIIDVDSVTGAPACPVARDDALASDIAVPLAGNLFADNGFGADTPCGNEALVVLEVQGTPVPAGGETVPLPSGAVIVAQPDGSFTYDGTAFTDLIGLGTTIVDGFSYTLAPGTSPGSQASVSLNLTRDDTATAGDDFIVGTAFADIIDGGAGNDTIQGWGGDDVLLGGDGADQLWGGAGDNHLSGGPGPDVFLYVLGDGNVVIDDFEDGVDSVQADIALLDLSLTPAEMFGTYVSQTNGDLIFTFGNSSLTLKATTFSQARDDIDLVSDPGGLGG